MFPSYRVEPCHWVPKVGHPDLFPVYNASLQLTLVPRCKTITQPDLSVLFCLSFETTTLMK
jgi:hypothetical protein